ncbi:MAG TPA: hypothetical protein VIJ28_06640 [Chloroflexota bacterium]|jgi:radical SAM superfamily enzyme
MAGAHSIQVELPADLFERIREAAVRSDQPVESVMVDTLAMLFGAPRADWEQRIAMLEILPDAELWAVVYHRLAWPEGTRLRELAARGRQEALSDKEQAELAALIDEADRLTVLRSRALLILRRRGHDIRKQLKLGA